MSEVIPQADSSVRPDEAQLTARTEQLYAHAVKMAEQSFQRERREAEPEELSRKTKVFVETSVENLRRWASPGVELTPAVAFMPEMYPGYTKEDLARVADMLAARLQGA